MDVDWPSPLTLLPADRELLAGTSWRVPAFLDSADARSLDPDPDGFDSAAAAELFGLEERLGTETRWAPPAVARLLLTWSPRSSRVAADPQRLLLVLRAVVTHAHSGDRTPRRVTLRSISLIEALADDFVERIHWGAGSAFSISGTRRWSRQEARLRELARDVGGGQPLLELGTAPLPAEPVSLTAVPDDLTHLVLEVDKPVERALGGPWDAELLTACRRALARLAEHRPQVLRRRASVVNTALGLAWAVGSGNGVVGTPPAPWSGKDLAAAFGASSTTGRGHTLLEGLGGRHSYGARPTLGSVDLLTGRYRSTVVEERDQLHERGVAVCARDLDDVPEPCWWDEPDLSRGTW